MTGRLSEAFHASGGSSFTEFLAAHDPSLLPSGRTIPPAAVEAPHGTTIVGVVYAKDLLRHLHAVGADLRGARR